MTNQNEEARNQMPSAEIVDIAGLDALSLSAATRRAKSEFEQTIVSS